MINLLESGGFRSWCEQVKGDAAAEWKKRASRWAPGVRANEVPFESEAEELHAETRIDIFMSEVLIPIAAQTYPHFDRTSRHTPLPSRG